MARFSPKTEDGLGMPRRLKPSRPRPVQSYRGQSLDQHRWTEIPEIFHVHSISILHSSLSLAKANPSTPRAKLKWDAGMSDLPDMLSDPRRVSMTRLGYNTMWVDVTC